MLYLVRHAMPIADQQTPPADWMLTADGAASARQLMSTLPPAAHFVSSAERKAWETLPGAVVRRDDRLNEVRRGDEPWSGDFRERRRAWVEGSAHPGWETQQSAAARYQAAVRDALDAAAEVNANDVVLAGHGMAITNWLVHAGLVDGTAAGRFWEQLRFPDCWLVDGGALVGRHGP